MTRNMGGIDRILRTAIAAAIAYLWYKEVISGPLAISLMVLAVVFLLTSFIGFCPLYRLFGLSTRGERT